MSHRPMSRESEAECCAAFVFHHDPALHPLPNLGDFVEFEDPVFRRQRITSKSQRL